MKQETGINYTRQLKAVWRFKWLILLAVLLAGGVSLQFSLNRPVMYYASTSLMITTTQSGLSLPINLGISSTQDFTSQIAIMRSKNVLERAITRLEPDKAADTVFMDSAVASLQDALRINQAQGTNLVTLTVFSTNPDKAKAQADAVAEAYIVEAGVDRTADLVEAQEYIKDQINSLKSSKFDITLSQAFPGFTVQLRKTLDTLETVAELLKQVRTQENVVNAVDVAEVMNQITGEIERIGVISDLAGQLSSGSAFVGLIRDQTDFLIVNINEIQGKLDRLTQTETDSVFYSKLQNAKNLLVHAAGAADNIYSKLVQLTLTLITLSSNSTALEPVYQETQAAVTQKAGAVDITLQLMLDTIPSTSKTTVPKIDLLNQKVSSATASLRDLTNRLYVTDSEQEILVTYTELAELDNQVKRLASNLLSLYQGTRDMRTAETDAQVYRYLLEIEELLQSASSTGTGFTSTVGRLTEGSLNYTTLVSTQQQIQLASLTNKGDEIKVVEAAIVTNPNTNLFNRFRSVVLAMFAVLFLGIFCALAYQYIDKKVRDSGQVAGLTGMPLLARISAESKNTPVSSPAVSIYNAPELLEDFRTLRTNLGLDNRKGSAFLVSSPESGVGKTIIAANLARVVALQKRKVLLIDGNLRNPEIAAAFGVENDKGLVEFLSEAVELSSCITTVDGIDILAVQNGSGDSSELLSSPRMKSLMEDARRLYDIIIIDSNPVLPYADAIILSRVVDEVLLVIKQDFSRIDLVERSRQALQSPGVSISGFVLKESKHRKKRAVQRRRKKQEEETVR